MAHCTGAGMQRQWQAAGRRERLGTAPLRAGEKLVSAWKRGGLTVRGDGFLVAVAAAILDDAVNSSTLFMSSCLIEQLVFIRIFN